MPAKLRANSATSNLGGVHHTVVWLARPSHLIAEALRPRAVKWDGLASQTNHTVVRDIQGEEETIRYTRPCPLEQQMMEVRQKTVPSCMRKHVASPPGTCTPLFELPAEHTLRQCVASHLLFSAMILAGSWPKNALGEPELTYCLSAGQLLGSAFVLQLQSRYLCVP